MTHRVTQFDSNTGLHSIYNTKQILKQNRKRYAEACDCLMLKKFSQQICVSDKVDVLSIIMIMSAECLRGLMTKCSVTLWEYTGRMVHVIVIHAKLMQLFEEHRELLSLLNQSQFVPKKVQSSFTTLAVSKSSRAEIKLDDVNIPLQLLLIDLSGMLR